MSLLRISLFLALLSGLSTSEAVAGTCPEPLRGAKRLVLVSATGMNRDRAMLRLYVRDARTQGWRPVGKAYKAVIGRAGMAWGYTFRRYAKAGEPLKREGDKRTPAGFFRLGATFGFARSSRPGHVVLKTDETICVDDVRSKAYNTVQSRSALGPGVRGENMREFSIYRHGMFVDYPSSRKARAGSCIFLHLSREPASGTLGCIAMPEMTLLGVQQFAEPGTVLGVIPDTALQRFAGCLPAH